MSGEPRYPDSKNGNSIQDGLEFQDIVMEHLSKCGIVIQNYSSKKFQFERGENVQGFEIKFDSWCTKSGRLSIEIAEKTAIARSWVDSGIYAGKSIFYIQGNKVCFWLFQTSILRSLHRCKKDGAPRYEEKEEATIRTFYIPIEDANKYGTRFDLNGA